MKRVALIFLLFTAAVLLLCLAGLAAVDDASLVSWLCQRIETATGTQISYRQPPGLTRGLAPTLNLESVKIVDAERTFQAETDSFSLQISLPALLLGRFEVLHLSLGNTRVQLQDGARRAGGLTIDPARLWLKPVLHRVRLEGLSVSAKGETWRLPVGEVSELSLQLKSEGTTPELDADLLVEGDHLHVNAVFQGIYHATQQPLPFVIRLKSESIDGEIKGQAQWTGDKRRIAAQVQLHATDMSRWSGAVTDFSVPGELDVRARLSGPREQVAADNIEVQWRGPGQSVAQLNGRIDDLFELAGIQMQLSGSIDNANWLDGHLPPSLAPLARADLAARVSGTRSQLAVDDLSLHAETGEQLGIELGGSLQLVQQAHGGYAPEQLQATLAFAAPTTRAARALLFENIPEFGAIKGSAVVRSLTGDPEFERIDIETHDTQGVQVGLRGGIRQFPLDPDKPNRGYALDVSMSAAQTATFARTLGLDAPLGGPLQLDFRIEGDTPALALTGIRLSAGSQRALSLKAEGQLQFGSWARPDPLDSLDLVIDASSRSTQVVSKMFGIAAGPEFGGLEGHARLHTVSGKHRVDDIALHTVKGAAVQVELTGSAADLVVLPRPALAGLQLQLVSRGADTAALNGALALAHKPIPSLGGFQLRSRISGSDELLLMDNTEVDAGSEALLKATARGRVGRLSARTGWWPEDTDLKLTAESKSSQALAKRLGYTVPALGPLSAGAAIRDRRAVPVLENLRLRLGPAGREPILAASGQVGNLRTGQQVSIDAKLNLDGHNLAAFADRQQLQDLAPLIGTLRIADSNGVLGMQALQLNSDHPALTIGISGAFRDFSKPQTLQLKSQVKARDLALVGALFDQEWPAYGPLEVDSDINREGGNRLRITSVVKAGEKGLDADLHGDFSVDPPRFAGKLIVQRMPSPDLFKQAAKTPEQKPKRAPKPTQPVFSREPIDLGWLTWFDLALTVDVVSFDPQESLAESANMTVALQSGVLKLNPVTIRYPKGEMALTLAVDARREPRVQFTLYGKNLNPWLETDGQDKSSQVMGFDADLDTDIRLAATGDSVHALAASLDGDLYITTRHGKVRRGLLDLLFLDIVGWSASHIKREAYADVTCGVIDFSAKQGILSTNAFFLDLKSISITGEGDIDLGKEQVQYVFLPKKKSRLILKAEPVKVSGPLANPSVSAIPVASAVRTFGTLLFAPYVFVGLEASGYLMGKLDSKADDLPCLNYERTHHMADTPKDSAGQSGAPAARDGE